MILSGEEFDKKYQALFIQLSELPRELPDDKNSRVLFVQTHTNYSAFCEELAYAFQPSSMLKFVKSMGQYDKKDSFDDLAFMEALNLTIQNYIYDGVDSFRRNVGKNYFGKKENYYNSESLSQQMGGMSFISERETSESEDYIRKTMSRLAKMIRKANGLYEQNFFQTEDDLREFLLKEFENGRLRKGDIPFIVKKVMGAISVSSMDIYNDNDDENDRLLTDVRDMNEYTNGNNQKESASEYKRLISKMFQNWDILESAMRKNQKDYIKCFFTRSLLVPLKTKLDETGKRVHYHDVPAGDDEIYEILKPYHTKLCWNIMHKAYVHSLYNERPDGLYKIYALYLKETIKFSDVEIAECLGVGKSAISKQYGNYQDKIVKYLLSEARVPAE